MSSRVLVAGGILLACGASAWGVASGAGSRSRSYEPEVRPTLTLRPDAARAGQWLTLDLDGVNTRKNTRATYAILEQRRATGWRPVYVLNSRAAASRKDIPLAIPYDDVGGFQLDALGWSFKDRVRLPTVLAGRYRLVKEVDVVEGRAFNPKAALVVEP